MDYCFFNINNLFLFLFNKYILLFFMLKFFVLFKVFSMIVLVFILGYIIMVVVILLNFKELGFLFFCINVLFMVL